VIVGGGKADCGFSLSGGGIFNGSLGSMLPYIVKAKEDKMGIVMFDDIFHGSVRGKDIDVRLPRRLDGQRGSHADPLVRDCSGAVPWTDSSRAGATTC
jgi:hypothetical protein